MTPEIVLTQFVGSPHLVDETDGTRVHDFLSELLNQGQEVFVSFTGAETVATSFLNRAIGDLFRDFPLQDIEGRLHFESIEAEDLARLERVKRFAHEFYSDPEGVQSAREAALAEYV